MNIKEAKNQIKQSVSIYLAKDEYGNYKIPVEKQRPVFLIGAPGIGKTAIMEQIAKELDIAIVSYSMTHHTRQSALGLPFIVKKNYQGEEYDVSEYTMSEIIASVYESMEKSGKKEGILFLDEINCVSETLAPSMLQFLQYKTFGNHRVPQGWVICTAGNPPEYNRSVHEFDVVTMDRLKVMEAEADLDVWRIYAEQKGLHNAILSYLDIKKDDFYHIENTVDGKVYVTARGWEDLSEAIFLYEEKGFKVDESLIGQYIRDKRVAGEFATYYELYEKYKEDYGIRNILKNGADEAAVNRAKEANFDERTTVMGLIIEALRPGIRCCVERKEALKGLLEKLKTVGADSDVPARLAEMIEEFDREALREEAANGLSHERRRENCFRTGFLEEMIRMIRLENVTDAEAFELLKKNFNEHITKSKEADVAMGRELENAFDFTERAFGDDNEMLLLVTELTVNKAAARFITDNGCDKYYQYNKKLMLHERSRNLREEIEEFKRMQENTERISDTGSLDDQ